MADNHSLPIPESYWVLPGQFLAGENPGALRHTERTRKRLDAFLVAGFDTFIDLTSKDEPTYKDLLAEQSGYFERQVTYRRFPIGDFGLPRREQMKELLDFIDQSIAENRTIYLHCWAGVGRTGTVVGCYLVRHGRDGNAALKQLSDWWRLVPKHVYMSHSPETQAQVNFVRNWQEDE
jgi:protein-tyrosine phosphatase